MGVGFMMKEAIMDLTFNQVTTLLSGDNFCGGCLWTYKLKHPDQLSPDERCIHPCPMVSYGK